MTTEPRNDAGVDARVQSQRSTNTGNRVARIGEAVRETLRFCLQRQHLMRTVRIALVVGVLLTAINQGSVLLGGHPTTTTWVRCGLNFLIPFLVSNAGLVSGRR